MRYPPDQKAKARELILAAGAEALRTNGFNGIGVDGLAAAAGVTSGAFYSNFASKEALLEGVIDSYLGKPFVDLEADNQAARQQLLKEWLVTYISDHHRKNPGAGGCVMPTLSEDVARASLPVRNSYQDRMLELVEKIARALSGPKPDRERCAWSIVATMVGAISIARAMPDDHEASRAIDAALKTAIALIN